VQMWPPLAADFPYVYLLLSVYSALACLLTRQRTLELQGALCDEQGAHE
jgi:hypothetical protein